MADEILTIPRERAITLINDSIENFFIFYDSYCHDNKKNLSKEQTLLYDQMNEVMMIVKKDQNYNTDLKQMPLNDLKNLLLACKQMVELNDLSERFSYPKGEFVIVDNKNNDGSSIISNNRLITKSLEKLELHGDSQIQKSIKEWKCGERSIIFSDMSENTAGETIQKNDFYTHYINSNYGKASYENEVRVAITLAHEFKRKANSNTLTGETREIILEDTKIIESFANEYGEDIYKKFPEYGILHYIKKIYGETELKEFADYAFDSSGSYWKVNSDGDLVDDGNISKVIDVNGHELYSGSTGLQGTLQAWLNFEKQEDPYVKLMKSAGFSGWDGKQWKNNPGKISHSVIKDAYDKGELTEQQYQLINKAANLIEKDDKKIEQKEPKKDNFFKQILQDYMKAELIKTQMQVDLFNKAFEKFIGNKKEVASTNDNKTETASSQASKVSQSDETKSKINSSKQKGIYYKKPKGFEEIFTPDIMNNFIQDSSGSKCNLFLEKVTQNLPEEIANKILPDGIKSALEMYTDWQNNTNLKCLNPESHFNNNRSSEQKSKDAEIAGEKANEMANQGYLVLAASPDFDYVTVAETKHYTAHVAIIISQDNIYNFDAVGDAQTCFLNLSGNTGHQGRKEPEILRDYPVCLQAGNSTGIVPPGWAFSRGLFLNDKVDYYVVKN